MHRWKMASKTVNQTQTGVKYIYGGEIDGDWDVVGDERVGKIRDNFVDSSTLWTDHVKRDIQYNPKFNVKFIARHKKQSLPADREAKEPSKIKNGDKPENKFHFPNSAEKVVKTFKEKKKKGDWSNRGYANGNQFSLFRDRKKR